MGWTGHAVQIWLAILAVYFAFNVFSVEQTAGCIQSHTDGFTRRYRGLRRFLNWIKMAPHFRRLRY